MKPASASRARFPRAPLGEPALRLASGLGAGLSRAPAPLPTQAERPRLNPPSPSETRPRPPRRRPHRHGPCVSCRAPAPTGRDAPNKARRQPPSWLGGHQAAWGGHISQGRRQANSPKTPSARSAQSSEAAPRQRWPAASTTWGADRGPSRPSPSLSQGEAAEGSAWASCTAHGQGPAREAGRRLRGDTERWRCLPSPSLAASTSSPAAAWPGPGQGFPESNGSRPRPRPSSVLRTPKYSLPSKFAGGGRPSLKGDGESSVATSSPPSAAV